MSITITNRQYALAKIYKDYAEYANQEITISDEEAIELGVIESEEQSGEQESEEHNYSKDYLTFEAIEDTTFKFINNGLSYSIDNGNNWINLNANTDTPLIRQGEKIIWKNNIDLTPVYDKGIGMFISTGKFNVSGNVMSLIYSDNFYNTNLNNLSCCFMTLFNNCKIVNSNNLILPNILSGHCYANMFKSCEYLINTPKLLCKNLLNSDWCYWCMFKNCTSLTTAPELPATTLSYGCYASMFENCTSLTTAPILPATTLAQYCYNSMFRGCTLLIKAPELPATTLTNQCYYGMFWCCTSLNYIKCLAQYYINESNTGIWLADISPIGEYSQGTFIKHKDANWSIGESGIPNNWLIEEVEE